MTCPAVETNTSHTIVLIDLTVLTWNTEIRVKPDAYRGHSHFSFGHAVTFPAVDTNTVKSADGIRTCPLILANRCMLDTFIHVFSTKLALIVWWTVACVISYAVKTFSSILTDMAKTVVNIGLTVFSREPCNIT